MHSNIWTGTKNLKLVKGQGISASSKTFVPAQKPILLNANHLFVWHKIFVTATICKLRKGLDTVESLSAGAAWDPKFLLQ